MKKALVFIFTIVILVTSIRIGITASGGTPAPQQRLDKNATPTFNGVNSTGPITAPTISANLTGSVTGTATHSLSSDQATTAAQATHATSADTATYAVTAGSTTGNAATVTNGVYTSGSYTDPAWINTLAGSKITGPVTSAGTASTALALNSSGANTGGSLSLAIPLGESSGGTGTNHVQWKPISQCVSHMASTVTGTTAITSLLTCTIPGGTIGIDGTLEFEYKLANNNSSGTKTYRISYGGVQIATGANTTQQSWRIPFTLQNTHSASRQIGLSSGTNPYGQISNPFNYFSINTAIDQPFSITCTLSDPGDSCWKETLDMKAMNP